jgi:hypothetical protein
LNWQPEAPREIRILVQHPTKFYLVCVPSVSPKEVYKALRTNFQDWLYESEVEESIKYACLNTELFLEPFSAADLDEFYLALDESDITEEEEIRCRNAQVVFPFFAEGSEEQSYFAPFWTAFVAGYCYAAEMKPLLIDTTQGKAYEAETKFWQYQCEGVPLTHKFLAVKGVLDGLTNRYTLVTNGMARFGLPELELLDVPPECGQDGAYLLRGVAQYIWNGVDITVPEHQRIVLPEENDISSAFCEFDKFARFDMEGSILPIGFCWSETEPGGTRLSVVPTNEFALTDQWFGAIIGPLRDQRTSLQNIP